MVTKANPMNFFLKNPPVWASILPIQIIGLYPIYLLITGQAVTWWWQAFIPGYICLFMLGASAGYHRLISHRHFQTSKTWKRILIFFGIMSGQGSPLTWAAIHRGYHHRHSDTDQDLHTPKHGFWHSYITWMFKTRSVSVKSVKDLRQDPDIIFAHRNFLRIFFTTNLIVAFIDTNLWLFLLVLPAWVSYQSISLTTSFNHIEKLGYKNYPVRDTSVNCIWLWPLVLGEAWHNNHHGAPRSASMTKRWWEIDPTYWLIRIIRKN